MSAPHATPGPRMHWGLLLTAATILMITMGVRQTTGLFMAPIHESTGIGIASISFALAIGQFVWGAVQPVFGAIADKHGPTHVLVAGGLMLAWSADFIVEAVRSFAAQLSCRRCSFSRLMPSSRDLCRRSLTLIQ